MSSVAALIAVRGVDRLAAQLSPRLVTPALAAMVLVSALSLRNVYGPKQDYVGALQYARSQAGESGVVASADLASYVYTHFLSGPRTLRTPADLTAARRGQHVYLLYTLTPVFQAQLPDLYAAATSQASAVKRFPGTLKDGTVFVAEFAPLP